MTTSLGLVDAFEKAAQIRRNRSRGLRDLSLFSPVAANRDAAAGAKMSTAASTREAVPPGAPTVAYTPGATRPEPSTRQWTPTPSVRVTRDTRAEGSSSEPGTNGFGPSSSMAGETLPIPRDAAGAVLDAFPAYSNPRVSGLTVHRGRVVAARAATDSEPRLGEAS